MDISICCWSGYRDSVCAAVCVCVCCMGGSLESGVFRGGLNGVWKTGRESAEF